MTAIDEVKARLDIVETVTRYVPALKRSGRTWKAPCTAAIRLIPQIRHA